MRCQTSAWTQVISTLYDVLNHAPVVPMSTHKNKCPFDFVEKWATALAFDIQGTF